MKLESAEISLVGAREENQDRSAVIANEHASLGVVLDGMGGHAGGSLAAETALKSILDSFARASHPLMDPRGFLHRAAGRAHDALVALGTGMGVEARPRATCAMVLIQQGASYWAHIGDSRIYHLREDRVLERTRDHSHVEQLLRKGAIQPFEVSTHPMRNFVECCLGGEAILPEMSITRRKPLLPGDALLLCSDGFWSHLGEREIACLSGLGGQRLSLGLQQLAEAAVALGMPHSDNTTAAIIRRLPD